MRTYLVAFALSLFGSLVLTYVVRNRAIAWGLFDEVGGRKLHRRPVPRLGGVAVVLSLAIPLLALNFYDNKISRAFLADEALLTSLLGGTLLMTLTGLLDDLKGVRAMVKLLAQLAAAGLAFWAGIRIEAIAIPFMGVVDLGMLALPITLFWFLLVTNAINLIDGLDGLAGGVVVLAGGTLFVMSVIEGNMLAALLLSVMLGATLGFLRYNVNPASIFLGDTGSLTLGYLLALVSVHSAQKSYALFSIIAAVMALGLPIFDLAMAVVRRFLSGQPIFAADQNHIHHLLLRKGLSPSKAVISLIGVAVVLEVLALVFIYADDAVSAVSIGLLVVLITVAVRKLGYTDLIRSARRTRMLKDVERDAWAVSERISEARQEMAIRDSFDGLWDSLCGAAGSLRIHHVELVLIGNIAEAARAWTRPGGETTDGVHQQTMEERSLKLMVGQRQYGVLTVGWYREDQAFGPLAWQLARSLADGMALGLAGLELGKTPLPLKPPQTA